MNKNFYSELLAMCVKARHALDILEMPKRNVEHAQAFADIQAIGLVLLDGTSLRSDVRGEIELAQQLPLARAARRLGGLSSVTGQGGKNLDVESAIESIRVMCIAQLGKRKAPSDLIVFYSWQSTLENSLTRRFMRDCLEKATKEINRELLLEDAMREDFLKIDSDTSGTYGANNVAETILKKIDMASIFVADVSLVHSQLPNANVMIELGYALKALGPGKIIMLMNESFGEVRDLPFDLGFLKTILYTLSEDDPDKTSKKKNLTARMANEIRGLLDAQHAEN
ncbi:MAG: hypothetical protein ACREGC_02105 [Minisyncoccia bacterium]